MIQAEDDKVVLTVISGFTEPPDVVNDNRPPSVRADAAGESGGPQYTYDGIRWDGGTN